MSDLQFGPDGYLDLSGLPDGDPDAVLDADALATVHDAVADDGAAPGLADDTWNGLVDDATSGETDIDVSDIAVPGSDGPFDVSGWDDVDTETETAATAETDDGDDEGIASAYSEPVDETEAETDTESSWAGDEILVDEWSPTVDVHDDYAGPVDDDVLPGNQDGLSPEDDDGIIDF